MPRTLNDLLLAFQVPGPSLERPRSYCSTAPGEIAQGDLEGALAAYQDRAKAAPNEPAWRQKAAELLQKLGRTTEALAEYEAAAELWAKTGAMLRAMALCKVILQLDPRHIRIPALLAHLQQEQSRSQAAHETRGVTTSPDLTRGASLQSSVGAPPVEKAAPIPFFSSLNRDVFLEVLAGFERRVYPPGAVIAREGAPGRSMFIIVEGEVSVVRQGDAGPQLPLATLSEGEFFGEMALMYEGPRLSSVTAVTETVLLELSRERMQGLAARYPQLGEVVHRLYRQRLLANALRSNPLFAGWPEDLCQKVTEAFTPVSVPAGEEILTQGQPGHALYLLLRGRCAAFHRHVDGAETPYPEMAEGDVFGEISLLRGKPATASVRALTPCVLLKLEREILEQHLPRHPMLHKELQRLGAERMLRTTMVVCGHRIHRGDSRA
jgi:cAMP-dependent protein kinase regulator